MGGAHQVRVHEEVWFGMTFETDWTVGSPWKPIFPDGRIADAGETIEFDRPRRIIFKWRNEFRPELKAEGYARCAIVLEPQGGAVSGGWPRLLANLKSLLETGQIILS